MSLLQKQPLNANAADEATDTEQLPLFNLFSHCVNPPNDSYLHYKIRERIIWLLLALITGYWSDEQILAEAPRYFRHFFSKLKLADLNKWQHLVCPFVLRFAKVIIGRTE